MMIESLQIYGKNLAPANLEFVPACTIISGASDTGKTFIYECLEFMLGSDSVPKTIPESEKYERIVLSLKAKEGSLKLERALRGGEYLLTDKDGERSISRKDINDFFLEQIGLGKKRLKKNQNNVTVALSFSYLRKYFFVDEVSIVDQRSPVLSEDRMNQTRDKSIFRLVLTGKDDSDLIEVEDKKITNAKKSGSSKTTSAIIEKLNQYTGKKTSSEIAEELSRCDKRISHLTGQIDKISSDSSKLLREKQALYSEVDNVDNQGKEITETLYRFNLLNDAYKKDLDRLTFIGEGKHLLAQLPSGTCPHCGREMNHLHEGDSTYNAFDESLIAALDIEKKKILSLQQDLFGTIQGLQNERQSLREKRIAITTRMTAIDKELTNDVSSPLKSLKENLSVAMEDRDRALELKLVSQHIQEIESLGNSLSITEDSKATEVADSFGEDSSLFLLEGEIEKILESWFANKPKVKFDKEAYDIVIDGRARRSFGKGFRSIYRTAFLMALMNLSIDKDLPHPRFLVIDSPLTTHEEADDQVDSGIQAAFFEYFSNYKRAQVIILENKEPDAAVQKKVKYVRFHGIKGSDGSGFFPA